jgi:hypothetical protein
MGKHKKLPQQTTLLDKSNGLFNLHRFFDAPGLCQLLQTVIMPLLRVSCPLKISALMQSTVHARIPASFKCSRLFTPALFLPIPASLKKTALTRYFCA